MVYAIIDAVSDVEELITVAYAETPSELAKWFVSELCDTADMYLSSEDDMRLVEEACESLSVICEDESALLSDVDGIVVEAGTISLCVAGAYYNYEDMKRGLLEFISDKPAYKKLNVPDNENESIKILDDLNAELIRYSL